MPSNGLAKGLASAPDRTGPTARVHAELSSAALSLRQSAFASSDPLGADDDNQAAREPARPVMCQIPGSSQPRTDVSATPGDSDSAPVWPRIRPDPCNYAMIVVGAEARDSFQVQRGRTLGPLSFFAHGRRGLCHNQAPRLHDNGENR
jgi:hypothetical protein